MHLEILCPEQTALLPFFKKICYFKDIRFDEPVEFMPGFKVSEEEVKSFLTDAALTGF